MKLAVFSDCHVEFHRDDGNSLFAAMRHDPDTVAVVAGDLSTLPLLDRSLSILCKKYRHVVFVVGNHEYYGFRPVDVDAVKAEVKGRLPNLHWLEREMVEIDGVRFVGTTLWFPRPGDKAPKYALNDYHQIRGFEPWVYEEHGKSLEFLTQLREQDVLVTHHFPFSLSIASEHAGSSLNPFFHAGEAAEALVAECKKPRLAIHGHTHSSFDYTADGIRVVCNPFGYPGENRRFDFSKTVDLE